MTRARYLGHFTAVYPAHRDLETGATLTAVPGGIYSVSEVPGDGRWATLADDPPVAPEPAPAASTGASEPDTIPAAGEPAASPESEA